MTYTDYIVPEQLRRNFEPHEIQTAVDLCRCAEGPATAATFRRIVLLLLQGHYASPENFGETYDHLKCMRWSPNESDQTIFIGFSARHDDDHTGTYPAIYVGFGGVSVERVAFGSHAGDSDDAGTEFITKQAKLTLVVNHIAKEAGDAYDMADMSTMFLTAMGTPIALKAGAMSFDVLDYAEPKKESPSPVRQYTVAMRIEIGYNLAVARSLESHRLRRIVQSVDVES